MKLSSHDRKDLEKFTKFLALKSAQVIVQSRLGEKKSTPCKTHTSSSDWFNLAIEDLPEVLAETKRALNGEVINSHLPLCVEISLRTVEGDHMVLESWCLGLLPQQCDPTARVIHTVYNRMAILLKSLVSVTRVTPAYKLSRRQGPDSYVICYRIYMDEPQLHSLGDGYKKERVGQICTPIGTVQLTVSYRTKLTISPTQNGRDNSIMLKSDHFNTNLSPRHMRYKQNEENNASLSNTMKIGAFADTKKKQIEPELIIPSVPFGKLLSDRLGQTKDQQQQQQQSQQEKSSKAAEDTAVKVTDEDKNGNSRDNSRCCSPPDDHSASKTATATTITMTSTNDDFIMVDLKTPFASTNANSELGKIYREWQSAPPLETFSEVPPLAEQVHDLAKQLESYECDMQKFDDVLQSLCQSPNNN